MKSLSLLLNLFFVTFNLLSISNSDTLSVYQVLQSSQDATVRVSIDDTTSKVTITLTINSARFLGVGFGNDVMSGTYAIIISGTTTVQERKLGNHASGTVLTSTITVISDTTTNSIRTVVIERDSAGTGDYFDFSSIAEDDTIDFIWARGSSTTFSQHTGSNRDPGTLTFHGPTSSPSEMPSNQPTVPTSVPSLTPTAPSETPTNQPSSSPTAPSIEPSTIPTALPSFLPSNAPTDPSQTPTNAPTNANETFSPTGAPSVPTAVPTVSPTPIPTGAETIAYVRYNTSDSATYDLTAYIALLDDNTVNIELSGPSGQWIGFGFGQTVMDGTYAIIIDGDGNVSQRELGDHTSGTVLTNEEAPSYTEVSNFENNGRRYIELSANIDDTYYDFSSIVSDNDLSYIMASSTSVTLEQHDYRESGTATPVISNDLIETTEEGFVTTDDNSESGGPNNDDDTSNAIKNNSFLFIFVLGLFAVFW